MAKKYKYLIGLAVFFMLCLGGVIYGVVTHSEPGLLQVCWRKGEAIYHNPGCVSLLQWKPEQFPLRYYLDLGAKDTQYTASIEAGINLWNEETGLLLFEPTIELSNADVTVIWGEVQGKSAGNTRHFGKEGPERAVVELSEPSDIHMVYRYAAHEMGHVLGLAHDVSKKSIMYPFQAEMTDKIDRVLPSDSDISLLRNIYKR